MKGRESRRYEMFIRAQTFGSGNAIDFAAGSTAVASFTALNGIIAGLDTAKAGQKPGRDTLKETLLGAIKRDIQNITRTAAAIDQTERGFADNFRPPKQFNAAELLTTAKKFLQRFTKQPALVAKFTAHELPADFVAAFQADLDAYGKGLAQFEARREAGVGNTVTIRKLTAQGMKTVNTLDAIMHNKYASQPAKLAAWQTASHLERAARHDKTPTSAPITNDVNSNTLKA